MKKDGLIICGGRDITDLEDSLPEVESTDPPADEYTKFIRKLDKHFLPKKNKDYARFQLGNLQQEEDKSLAKYFARVREIGKKCEYHDENNAIRDHLIKTMRNRRIRVKAIRQGWTLQEILNGATIDEETNQRPKWKRRFLTKKKMSNAWKKTHLQNHVVDVGINTRKNAWHSVPLAPHVANETIMQTSAKVNHKKRKDIVHSKTKLAIQKTLEQDTISEEEEIPKDQTSAMGKSTKCQVTRKSTRSPIPATHRAMNVSSTTSRSTKQQVKAFKRPAPFS